MKNKFFYLFTILLAASSLFLASCGNNAPIGSLALDNGQKWKINTEMMPPLEASQKLIAEFQSKDNQDYQGLAKTLKENNKQLISSCTMKGKSHDELHKWLHPYMSKVEELSAAEDDRKAEMTLQKIEQSFTTFNQYFQ